MSMIQCVKCGAEAEQMEQLPLGGAIGRQVQAQVCEDCWNEWKAQQILVINHYGLMLHITEHRQQLLGMMKEFLNMPQTAPAHPPAEAAP